MYSWLERVVAVAAMAAVVAVAVPQYQELLLP
jgi:hypothetical protein